MRPLCLWTPDSLIQPCCYHPLLLFLYSFLLAASDCRRWTRAGPRPAAPRRRPAHCCPAAAVLKVSARSPGRARGLDEPPPARAPLALPSTRCRAALPHRLGPCTGPGHRVVLTKRRQPRLTPFLKQGIPRGHILTPLLRLQPVNQSGDVPPAAYRYAPGVYAVFLISLTG